MIPFVNSGRTTQASQAEEDAPAQHAEALEHPLQPAVTHPDLAARRGDSTPPLELESGDRPRMTLDSFRASTSPPRRTGRLAELLQAARDESRGREESPEIPHDPLRRGLSVQITSSPEIADTGLGPAPLIAETRRTRLHHQLTLTDIVIDPPAGETSESPAALLPIGERSDRFTRAAETASNVGSRRYSAGLGERRSAMSPSGRPNPSQNPLRRGDSSSGSSTVYSAGLGERRNPADPASHEPSTRDPATGSPIYTPNESQRFSFPVSGEQPTTALPVFGTSSSSSSESVPPSTSRRAAIADLVQTARHQAAQTAGVVTLLQPNTRLLGAAAGHLAHQAVSVGIPTFVREMIAAGLTAGLHASPQVAIALQTGMMVMNTALQVVRERRESRNPDEAARAFHALSAEQWQAASPDEQAAMRQTQAKHSRLISALQVCASALNLGLGVGNVRSGDTAAAVSRVATDVKTAVYTTMRDSLQASFRMVGIQGETHGLSGAHLTTAIATYAAAGLTAGYVGQALAASSVPQASTAASVRNGALSPAEAGMSMAAAWGTAATLAGVKAAVNTVVEAIDWFQRTQLEAMQGGATQQLAPRLNTAPGHRDYGRLLDHMPGRMAVINTVNSAVGAAGYLARNSSAALQSLIGNAGSAAINAMLDYSLTNTWQAEAAVRAATNPQPTEPEADAASAPTPPATSPAPPRDANV